MNRKLLSNRKQRNQTLTSRPKVSGKCNHCKKRNATVISILAHKQTHEEIQKTKLCDKCSIKEEKLHRSQAKQSRDKYIVIENDYEKFKHLYSISYYCESDYHVFCFENGKCKCNCHSSEHESSNLSGTNSTLPNVDPLTTQEIRRELKQLGKTKHV